jgi:hypothetical protein
MRRHANVMLNGNEWPVPAVIFVFITISHRKIVIITLVLSTLQLLSSFTNFSRKLLVLTCRSSPLFLETIDSLSIAATADDRSDSNNSIDDNRRQSAGLCIAHATAQVVHTWQSVGIDTLEEFLKIC